MTENILENETKKPLITAGELVSFRDSWRIFKIMAEFVDGYDFLSKIKDEVTILGSARLPISNKYYKIAEELGGLLGKNKLTTLTGGGPGIMEAANKGAFEAGGESVGINIQLPREQRTNPYVKKSAGFYYFFTRKVMLTSPANAFVFFPGGFGTMDEFFEVVDYIELDFMKDVPIVLVGKEFWQPLIDFLRAQSARKAKSVSEEVIDKWHVVDSAQEAIEILKETKDNTNICIGNSCLTAENTEWKIFRIMAEMVDGFEFLSKIKNDVTILGTKSILVGSPYYNAAYEIGKLLAGQHHTVITGGGPGIMEAANKGAFEVGGESVGVNMKFERGERVNNFITKSIGFSFPFIRKLIITAPSKAFVFFPGGFGTLHQLFELLTMQETKKMEPIPIILYGKEFWQPLLHYFHTLYTDFKTIGLADQDLVKVIDDPKDLLKYL